MRADPLENGVPVALATDDEGVARSSMTREYRRAVEEQRLDYRTLKSMGPQLHRLFVNRDLLKMMRYLIIIAALVAVPRELPAQDPPVPAAGCTYESCALGLAPVWNGLAITRGISQRQIANLGFFWPTDVTPVFRGDAPAVEAATEAVRMRTVAAVLTDAGLILIATGLARAAFDRRFDSFATAVTGVGVASLAVSIPFQFAADGYLSRAVWWHNRRFSR